MTISVTFTLGTLRQARGLSQGEVAKKLGVTRQTITNIEKDGLDRGMLRTAFKLAEIYGVSIADLPLS